MVVLPSAPGSVRGLVIILIFSLLEENDSLASNRLSQRQKEFYVMCLRGKRGEGGGEVEGGGKDGEEKEEVEEGKGEEGEEEI